MLQDALVALLGKYIFSSSHGPIEIRLMDLRLSLDVHVSNVRSRMIMLKRFRYRRSSRCGICLVLEIWFVSFIFGRPTPSIYRARMSADKFARSAAHMYVCMYVYVYVCTEYLYISIYCLYLIYLRMQEVSKARPTQNHPSHRLGS